MLLGNAPQSGVKATESQLKHAWKHLLQTSGKYLVESAIYYMQCWEGYFENVIGYSLQVTLFKM